MSLTSALLRSKKAAKAGVTKGPIRRPLLMPGDRRGNTRGGGGGDGGFFRSGRGGRGDYHRNRGGFMDRRGGGGGRRDGGGGMNRPPYHHRGGGGGGPRTDYYMRLVVVASRWLSNYLSNSCLHYYHSNTNTATHTLLPLIFLFMNASILTTSLYDPG